MTDLHAAASAEPGQWLLEHDVGWSDLVRYGPPTFEVYVRVAFEEPSAADERHGADALRHAIASLAAFTNTPGAGYAAVWEGWAGVPLLHAPLVDVPERPMRLFRGPLDVLRDAPALAWYGSAHGRFHEPQLVWPEDRVWCVACEVDEDIEFTVGCSEDAALALAQELPGSVRRVEYGQPAPLYRDEG